jgi:hypothetical protein
MILKPNMAFGLHLPAHGDHDILGRRDVLDLDAQHLDAPRAGRLVDHRQQRVVDVVALGQRLVERHVAHDAPDVGERQVGDGEVEVLHLVGGARRIDHLVEGDGVDLHRGVVLGDELLRRNVEDVLLHVHLVADRIHEGHDEMQPGRQGARVASEPFDGPVGALRHRLYAREHQHQRHDDQQDEEDQSTRHYLRLPRLRREPSL